MNDQQKIIVEYAKTILTATMTKRDPCPDHLFPTNDSMSIELVSSSKNVVANENTAQVILDLVFRVLVGNIQTKNENPWAEKIEIITYTTDNLVKICFSKKLPQIIYKPLMAMQKHLVAAGKYCYGDHQDIVGKMYIPETGECCDEANNSGVCANCTEKYLPLLAILLDQTDDESFAIYQKFQEHHTRESKNSTMDKIMDSRKWEKYLLSLAFKARQVEFPKDMLDEQYISRVITPYSGRKEAAQLISVYKDHHKYSTDFEITTIRKYRELIVKYHSA